MKILVAGSKRSISGDARRCLEFNKCAADVGRALSRNAQAADHIELLLRRKHRAVFRDEAILRLGATFENDIKEQLQRSDTYVGLWSKSFAESDWCEKELNWAIELQRKYRRPRRIHLILLDETPLKDQFKPVLHAPGAVRGDRLASLYKMLDEEIR
jgi:hypothetical protein